MPTLRESSRPYFNAKLVSRLATVALVLLFVVLSWSKDISAMANAQVDAGLKRSLVSFASARALNAIISVVQGTEVVVQPLGVGITLALGQVLDPINNLVEQFSSIMLTASVAFGIQKLLLAVASSWAVSAGVTILALAWASLFWINRAPEWLSRLLVVVVFLRLVMPVTLIGSAFIFEKFLASDYESSLLVIDQTGAALKKLNGGASTPTRPGHPPASAEPSAPASTASKPAASPERKGLFSGAMDALGGAKDAVVAAKDKLSDALDVSADRAQARFENIQAMAERTAERMVTLMVVFLMQTIVVPCLLLFGLYRLLGGLVGPATSKIIAA
ncbi:hypothetical protein HZ993_09330 [Rhodoferax sp. AJA081-3]|uniref:hypothetical protein n=1 Tax=Rhodoferax sp. AJA081-3 TaxID=2752316 RepID=UPI001ADF686A|nr:hypothetical protein [Rhodoferax sp. AJA081-3]QTN29982.1 hypothetical protein HZ993_09330 [Rhodoferax sp. AJA081-3]